MDEAEVAMLSVQSQLAHKGPEPASSGRNIPPPRAASAYLLAKGVPEEMQKIVAMGKSDPAVATGDGVPEARNRRVVITFGPGSGF